MSFNVQIIADSINTASPNRERITTLLCTFPRYILAELNTHRMFSRNSASSRAIPFRKMVEAVKTNPFIPIAWQKDHSGMQGTEYITSGIPDIEDCWLRMRDHAVEAATEENQRGVTKQLCNRLLEPFMWHTALITATEFENFFALRCPQYEISIDDQLHVFRSQKDVIRTFGLQSDMTDEYFLRINKGQGEIHIMKLAEMMWDAMNESKPKELKAGEWHIPFGDQIDIKDFRALKNDQMSLQSVEAQRQAGLELRIKIATARCAQTSYTVVGDGDKPMDYAKLIALHDRLATSRHWSPFEHCAQAMSIEQYCTYVHGQYPTTSDEWGIVNYERYPFITKPMFPDEEPRIGWNQSNPDIYGWCGNFRGWIQYRKMFPNENHTQ